MVSIEIVFFATVALTVASAATAAGIVVFGDTRRNQGQRNVAERLVQMAAVGMAAIAALLAIAV